MQVLSLSLLLQQHDVQTTVLAGLLLLRLLHFAKIANMLVYAVQLTTMYTLSSELPTEHLYSCYTYTGTQKSLKTANGEA